MEHIFYRRHFLLLAGFSVFLGVATEQHFSMSLSTSFALYGALHAAALVLSLRARQPLWRQCVFITIAAGLSVMTLRIGIFSAQLPVSLPRDVALFAAIGAASMTGAAAYGILIRLARIYALTFKELAVIAGCCIVAAEIASFTLALLPLGRSWLAIGWWFGFSGGLWLCDRRRRAANARSGTLR